MQEAMMTAAQLPETTLTTFTASDGDNLAVQDWALPEGVLPRGMVLLVHGMGEHAGRYAHLARQLVGWGFAVRGYDQCGHGDSGGARGGLPSDDRLIEDLADMVSSVRSRMRPGQPLIVLGHSLGALVAARFALARQQLPIDGLVLSSPALRVRFNRVQALLLKLLLRIAPNLTVSNGLDPHCLSHDPEVVEAYQADPLVHDRISGRMASFIADAGPQILAGAAQWKVPTLLMWAGQDWVVSARGSQAFADAAPPEVVSAKCFPELYHEIFNELEAEPVFATLKAWLDTRYPA